MSGFIQTAMLVFLYPLTGKVYWEAFDFSGFKVQR